MNNLNAREQAIVERGHVGGSADSRVVIHLARLSQPGYGGIRRSVSLHELAVSLEVSEASAARDVKRAVAGGYAERSGPRTLQQTWIATPKADALLASTVL